jgi:outer membrane protein assembly factor BamB
MVGDQLLRLWNEKGTIANLKMSDGSPAEASQAPGLQTPASNDDDDDQPQADQQKGFFMSYQEKEKALQCRNFSGNVVWERKGESSTGRPYQMGQNCVIWASTDGTVEVVNLADGAPLWTQKVDAKNSQPSVNDAGTYMVIQNQKEISIVKLGS